MILNKENNNVVSHLETRLFGSDKDKKYKLAFIFRSNDLLLSTRTKGELIRIFEILDLNMFADSKELVTFVQQELENPIESIKIPQNTLIQIAKIMVARNF